MRLHIGKAFKLTDYLEEEESYRTFLVRLRDVTALIS